jgi:hypothetical protein
LQRTCFVLLKLARTGSTSLGKALNTTVSFCRNEILNDWNPATHGSSQAYIDHILSEAKTPIRGFTLNPLKRKGFGLDFWRFPDDDVDQRLVLLLLRDPWPTTISLLICRHFGVYPGSRDDADAGAIRTSVDGGVHIDPARFAAAYAKSQRSQENLRAFALEYARRQAGALCTITYENMFSDEPTDLVSLEQALGIDVDRRCFKPELKILPDNHAAFIVNYAELQRATAQLSQPTEIQSDTIES